MKVVTSIIYRIPAGIGNNSCQLFFELENLTGISYKLVRESLSKDK